MARYKTIDTDPKLLAVDLARQLLPGTFEHAVNHLLDHAIDLSSSTRAFGTTTRGAGLSAGDAAQGGAVRLRARHREQPRDRARRAEEHVTFIALCGDHGAAFHDDRRTS